MGLKDFAVCFRSCNHWLWENHPCFHQKKKNCWALHELRNAYHGLLGACGPGCMLCTTIQGQRWRDVIMLLIPMCGVWVFSLFLSFPLRQYIFMHAKNTLMCLLMAKAIGLMERAVPSAVSQVFRHISLFKSPHISLFSLLISVCTVLFPSVFLYPLVWICWVQLLPLVPVVPVPGFSHYPFSWDVELLVRLLLMHVQLTSCSQQGSWLPLSQLNFFSTWKLVFCV